MRDRIFIGLIMIATVALSIVMFGQTNSPDFQATWIAGEFYHAGQFADIYPNDGTFFTSRPPATWVPHMQEQGYMGNIFPFIYPPIWAALAAEITQLMQYETLLGVMHVLNPLFVAGMVFLAWRAAAPTLSAPVYTLLGVTLLFITSIGSIALYQDQIQIFVSFLIVLAIERTRNGAPIMAGAAMGLAAALKLYPVIFALFWLLRGERRAAASFVLFGGALGFLSLAVSGWPLHAEFLRVLSTISNGVLLNSVNFAVETTLANLFASDQMQFIPSILNDLDPNDDGGWRVMEKPALWAMASKAGVLMVLASLCVMMRKFRDDIAVWPLALTVASLFSPLAWSFHFLPAVAFAPLLIERLGLRPGARILAVIFLPLMLGLLPLYGRFSTEVIIAQLVGFGTMALYAVCWALLLRRGTKPADTEKAAEQTV